MLGICVVYLLRYRDSEYFLHTSIARLKAYTKGPFRIYGAIARNSAPTTAGLLAEAGITLVELTAKEELAGASEHANLLDLLVDNAVEDGCTHVATFDMDSWPVVDGWDMLCAARINDAEPVIAAVRREENTHFPFPGFTFFPASFWRVGNSSFSSEQRAKFPSALVKSLRRWSETGAGILLQLMVEERGWIALERSNAWNPHAVMCGLYGDMVFHFGAGSRRPSFLCDRFEYGLNEGPMRDDFRYAINDARRRHLLALLQRDEEAFLCELRADNPCVPQSTSDLAASLATAQVELERLEGLLSERDLRLGQLDAEIAALRSSLSWRLTSPLRRCVAAWRLAPDRLRGAKSGG